MLRRIFTHCFSIKRALETWRAFSRFSKSIALQSAFLWCGDILISIWEEMGELVGVEKFYSFFFFLFRKSGKDFFFFLFFLKSGKVLFFLSFSFLEKWKSSLLAKTAGSTNLFPTPSLAAPQI